jgi:hypothetical protein
MRASLVVVAVLAGCGVPGQIDSQHATPPPPDVLGELDALDSSAVAAGWALSPPLQRYPLYVAFYLDGDTDAGTLLGTVKADQQRDDVNAATGVPGGHGFGFTLPATVQDGAMHSLHVYGLGPSQVLELEGSPKTFSTCTTAGPKVTPTPDETIITLTAANGKRVSATCGGDDLGVVTASAGGEGEHETFYVSTQPGGAVAIRSSHGRFLSAEGGGGAALHANRPAAGPWEQFHVQGSLVDGAMISLMTSDGAHYVSARIDETPALIDAEATNAGPWEQLTVHVIYSPLKVRHGVVRADGRSFVDDDGTFYPLGATMMWSLWGWKNDRARLQQNLQFLKQHHWDYVRILGEVDWAAETIDPNWPDYQQVLGELIDYAYDVCGLRTELTLVGGVGDPLTLAQKVAPVINAGRQHKILDVEIANESSLRPVTLQQLQDAGRYLVQNIPNLVALSSAEGLSVYAPSGTWPGDYGPTLVPQGIATLGTVHMDRTFGDDGWRETRQPWDFKDLPFPVSHNEPIGPRSSVAEETDPMRLAMLRAVGLINGVGAFVLHNGSGVTGQVDPAHNRPANLWEVPGIDDIMNVVRGIDDWMPQRAGEGQHWNNGWAGDPWVADAFWGDGADHGVNRNYSASTPDGWISTEAGVKDHVVLTASRHSRVEIFDIVKGKTLEVELQAGQTLTLTPDSRDDHGYGAFIIVGHYL